MTVQPKGRGYLIYITLCMSSLVFYARYNKRYNKERFLEIKIRLKMRKCTAASRTLLNERPRIWRHFKEEIFRKRTLSLTVSFAENGRMYTGFFLQREFVFLFSGNSYLKNIRYSFRTNFIIAMD